MKLSNIPTQTKQTNEGILKQCYRAQHRTIKSFHFRTNRQRVCTFTRTHPMLTLYIHSPTPHPLSFYLASSILSKKLICSIYESRSRSSRRETKLIYQVMQSPYYAPAHVDSSRPSLSFPLGTALLLIVIFSLSGIFSCCYHWDKLRSLRRSFNTDHEDDTDDAPSKPKHTQKVLFPPLLSF